MQGKMKYMVGVISLIFFTGCKQQQAAQQDTAYSVMEIRSTNRELLSSYSASIRGKSDIAIYPQISGYITRLCVEEGEVVRKGQTLFIIDQVPYQAALRTATANVNLAKANVGTAELTYKSKQELYKQNVISTFELQTAENALESAKAQLEQALAQETNARNNLSYSEVKSPSDGMVGTLPYKVGTLVSPSQPSPLTMVSDNSEMYVYFSMTEKQLLGLLREHDSVEKALKSMPPVQLQLTDNSVYTEKGRIETISGIIDQTTGSVTLRATFPNNGHILYSGGSGNVLIPQTMKDCIVIPKSATYEVQDKVYTFRNIDGVAKSTMVQVLPISEDNNYIVEAGLSIGDVIVAEGVGFIRDNTPIKVKQN